MQFCGLGELLVMISFGCGSNLIDAQVGYLFLFLTRTLNFTKHLPDLKRSAVRRLVIRSN